MKTFLFEQILEEECNLLHPPIYADDTFQNCHKLFNLRVRATTSPSILSKIYHRQTSSTSCGTTLSSHPKNKEKKFPKHTRARH